MKPRAHWDHDEQTSHRPAPETKIKAVYNKKLGRWHLCHTDPCLFGQSSIIAAVVTTLDDDADEAWAKEIERRFNNGACES